MFQIYASMSLGIKSATSFLPDTITRIYTSSLCCEISKNSNTFHHIRQVCVQRDFYHSGKPFWKSFKCTLSLRDSSDIGVMNISEEPWMSDGSCFLLSVLSSGLLRWLIGDFTEVDNQLQMVQTSSRETVLKSFPSGSTKHISFSGVLPRTHRWTHYRERCSHSILLSVSEPMQWSNRTPWWQMMSVFHSITRPIFSQAASDSPQRFSSQKSAFPAAACT